MKDGENVLAYFAIPEEFGAHTEGMGRQNHYPSILGSYAKHMGQIVKEGLKSSKTTSKL